MTRVLVCGGREYGDLDRVVAVLDEINPTVVIEGGARGADACAWKFTKMRGVERLTFPADWSRDGKAAGAIRNQRMLDEGKPDLVVAFPGGNGTADMVRRAKRAGIEVKEITS